MPYRRSRARKRFQQEVDLLHKTVREAYSHQCTSGDVRRFALCSAVLLCSARFESYLEDLLGDWARTVGGVGITTEKLHRRTRAFLLNQPAVVAAYRRYILEDDESALLTRLETLVGTAHYEFGLDGRPVPRFIGTYLYKDRKYPSPKNLRRLFNRFGFGNIFHDLNRLARRDTEALLTSFNDLRTEMAHVGMPVGLTPADIRQHIRNVAAVAGYVDRVFHTHVRRSVGSTCWTN
jgi:hypothetical protein